MIPFHFIHFDASGWCVKSWMSFLDEGSIKDDSEELDDINVSKGCNDNENGEDVSSSALDLSFDELEEERMDLEDLIGHELLINIYRNLKACFDSSPNLERMQEIAQTFLTNYDIEFKESKVDLRIAKLVLKEAEPPVL